MTSAVCGNRNKKDVYDKRQFANIHGNIDYGGVSLSRLLIKLLLIPITVLFLDYLIGSLYFPSFTQAILVGLVLAVIGHFMERSLLRSGTLWMTTGLDIAVTIVALLLFDAYLPGARIPLDAVFLSALILGMIEYVYHRWLLRHDDKNRAEL